MDRKNEIRAQIKPLLDELNRLEREEKQHETKGLIGRCFKYHNSYSCPKSDDDKWWIYQRITGVDSGRLHATSFQIDINGKIEIEASDIFNSVSGWQEISESEYQNAWAVTLHAVSGIDA